MKKLTLLSALFAILSLSAIAADGGKKNDDVSKVSSYVIRQFESEFYSAKDITWTVTEGFEKADFTVDNVKMAAYFDTNGKYLGHTEAVTYNVLPSHAKKQIAREYEGYHVKELIRFQYAETPSSALTRLTAINAFDDEVYLLTLYKADKQATLRITPSSAVELLSKN
ncbi:hypothetical protein [Mucilaginibacter terrae]|uniref:Beta-lactamase-inhibitor-like PepSY-like domain-containing protein n=1 Tax=Mucilaginibacter terrae TaxID=1955052 RepID=A0ABU3GST1_9SPHI|nr:hypothetical protein [Mucilaginibacter terrae]MDT3401720.1 hypothetical protein [Mucilaginibacter terrae]